MARRTVGQKFACVGEAVLSVMEYDLILRFRLPPGGQDVDDIVERLGEADYDDALVGIGHPGLVALEFVRRAGSAQEALFSAIRDVSKALPSAEFVEAAPDLVGVTDVAAIVGCSRQNMRKLLLSRGTLAPAPIHEGAQSIWHLANVLEWLRDRKGYRIPGGLMDLARATMQLNVAADLRNLDGSLPDGLRSIVA